jgi:hypothetical protein
MSTRDDIEAAEWAVTKLRRELAEAENNLNRLYVALNSERWNIAPGDKVANRKGEHFIVYAIHPNHWSETAPWLWGNPLLKDGSVGKANRRLFDWTLVEKAKP